MDHVCRTCLAKSCGSRDDSLSWNLSRVKQGGAIRTKTWVHRTEGVRWRGGQRVAVRRQDDAQVDRSWPEEGISAVSSVSSIRRANASRRQEQLRVSSSEEHKTLHKASRWGYSRAATGRARRWTCFVRPAHTRGGAAQLHNNRLHQTCRPVNQYTHVCVERCPLTMRHAAERSRDSCGSE